MPDLSRCELDRQLFGICKLIPAAKLTEARAFSAFELRPSNSQLVIISGPINAVGRKVESHGM